MDNSVDTTFGADGSAVHTAWALVPPDADVIRSRAVIPSDELPLTVKDAAAYLGLSQQTVYSWVERKQIPHLRVMGRNIRFLKSELAAFRAQFKQEVVDWQDQ